MLKTEQDTPEMGERVWEAFKVSDHFGANDPDHFDVFFEHGQWWVSHSPTGMAWSVVDAVGGCAIDGFDFELVCEGDV